jgi:hypothetical protein
MFVSLVQIFYFLASSSASALTGGALGAPMAVLTPTLSVVYQAPPHPQPNLCLTLSLSLAPDQRARHRPPAFHPLPHDIVNPAASPSTSSSSTYGEPSYITSHIHCMHVNVYLIYAELIFLYISTKNHQTLTTLNPSNANRKNQIRGGKRRR